MREFAFYGQCDTPLNDQIEMVDDLNSSNDGVGYIVANSREVKAEVYAPEVDFYLRYGKEDALNAAANVLKIYEAKAAIFDHSTSVKKSKQIGKNVLIVGASDLEETVKKAGFNALCFEHDEVKFVYGCAGELTAILIRPDGEVETSFDLLLVRGAKKYMLTQSGCYEVEGMGEDEIVALLHRASPVYNYAKYISYDPTVCQYADRRSEHCAICAKACHSVAILKDDKDGRKLVFSDIDCSGCGRCVSSCPTAALSYGCVTRDGLEAASELYDGKIMLMGANADFEDAGEVSNLNLEGVLPLSFKSAEFLDFLYFARVVQKTGKPLVLFNSNLNYFVQKSADFINEVYERIYGVAAVFRAKHSDELASAVEAAREAAKKLKESGRDFKFELGRLGQNKLDEFAARVSPLVESDLGEIKSAKALGYGTIEIDADKCTLCLSCAGACNTGALYADKSDNSLKYNPSLCTTCGYCEKSMSL